MAEKHNYGKEKSSEKQDPATTACVQETSSTIAVNPEVSNVSTANTAGTVHGGQGNNYYINFGIILRTGKSEDEPVHTSQFIHGDTQRTLGVRGESIDPLGVEYPEKYGTNVSTSLAAAINNNNNNNNNNGSNSSSNNNNNINNNTSRERPIFATASEEIASLRQSTVSSETLLQKLATAIDTSQTTMINVTRNNVIDGARRAIRRKKFSPNSLLRVVFADSAGVGEGAVDEGGPKREFLRLLMKQMRESSVIFEGPNSARHVTFNAKALRDGLYGHYGTLIALSLVHGGPAPRWFSEVLYNAVSKGIHATHVSTNDVFDTDIKSVLTKLQSTTSSDEVSQVIEDHYTLFSMAGCVRPLRPFSTAGRDSLINDLCHFIVLGRSGAAIQQLQKGLTVLNVLETIRKHPEVCRELFIDQGTNTLTADMMSTIFRDITFSPEGSNKRVKEEMTVAFWRDYLQEVEDGDREEPRVTLKDILVFVTDADEVPFMGFGTDPSIEFIHPDASGLCLPTANTWDLILRLPVVAEYEKFATQMDFGILSAPGFGVA